MYYADLNRFVARELGYDSQDGVYIARIKRRSPGDKAGLKLGDIITEINGKPVKNTTDVENIVYSTYPKVGDVLDITVFRNGRTRNIKLVLEKYGDNRD
jgi:S1-C subfamily serine protease